MLLRRHQVHPALTAGRALEQLASNLVGLAGPLRFQHHFGQWFPKTLTLIGVVWLLALGIALFAPGRHRRGQFSERRRVAVLVAQPNGGTLDPFALRRDRSYLFDRTGHGAVAFRVLGGVALVGGDQLGETRAADDAVGAFLARCDDEGWRPAALGVAESRLGPWHEAGMRSIRLGDEAIIDSVGVHARRPHDAAGASGVQSHEEPRGGGADRARGFTRRSRCGEHCSTSTWRDRGREAERGFSMALDGLLTDPDRDADCVIVIAEMAGEPVAFQRYVPCRGGRGLSLDAMRRIDRVDGQPLVNGHQRATHRRGHRVGVEAMAWSTSP